MDNYEAFVELRDRYNSITIEEVEKAFIDCGHGMALFQHLTGMGFTDTCTLCRSAREQSIPMCDGCLWTIVTKHACNKGTTNARTWDAFDASLTGEGIIQAYRARAKRMTYVIKKYNRMKYGH